MYLILSYIYIYIYIRNLYIFVESWSLTNCRKVIRLDLLHCCETSRYPCQSDHPPSFPHTSTGAVEEETTATTTSKIEFSSPTLVSGLHKIAGSPQRANPSPSVQGRVNTQNVPFADAPPTLVED